MKESAGISEKFRDRKESEYLKEFEETCGNL